MLTFSSISFPFFLYDECKPGVGNQDWWWRMRESLWLQQRTPVNSDVVCAVHLSCCTEVTFISLFCEAALRHRSAAGLEVGNLLFLTPLVPFFCTVGHVSWILSIKCWTSWNLIKLYKHQNFFFFLFKLKRALIPSVVSCGSESHSVITFNMWKGFFVFNLLLFRCLWYIVLRSALAAHPARWSGGSGSGQSHTYSLREEVKLHISCPSFPIFIPSCLLYTYRRVCLEREW